MAKRSDAKQEAKKLIEKLPDGASWDDIMYQFYVRQKYEHGIEAADRGEGMGHDKVKIQFRKDRDIYRVWAIESQRRWKAYKAGRMKTIPYSSVSRRPLIYESAGICPDKEEE